ncbi:MAG TPA: hypothetical protein VGK65_12295, partial [Candidatus Binatia bacterium]
SNSRPVSSTGSHPAISERPGRLNCPKARTRAEAWIARYELTSHCKVCAKYVESGLIVRAADSTGSDGDIQNRTAKMKPDFAPLGLGWRESRMKIATFERNMALDRINFVIQSYPNSSRCWKAKNRP